MKTQYNSLAEFAQEIERREATKQDYIVPTEEMCMVDDTQLDFATESSLCTSFSINDFAHDQIADKLGIPRKYYTKMTEIPGLRSINVNEWLQQSQSRKMIRTLDGKVRAFLTDSFKPLDNYDTIKTAILPVLEPMKKDLQIKALNISETKMYMQIVFPQLTGEVKVGDVINYGITISNSEVGAGSLNVESFIYRLACSNGMIRQSLFKKYHVGKRADENEDSNIWKSDTLQKELESYQLRLRDVLADSLNQKNFDSELLKLKAAQEDYVPNITRTVENVTKHFGLTDRERDSIIQNMAESGLSTRWGLANGITALAHAFENPDHQYQAEKLGSTIIELAPSQWKVLNAS